MNKLKVALLEDEEFLLKELKKNLEDTGLVEITFFALSAKEFDQKMEIHHPEALFLDIDLRGESLTGLDIAGKYNLPALFISGKTREFNTELEDLDINFDFPVMRLRKPVAQDVLLKVLKKFINEIRLLQKAQTLRLKFLNIGWQIIPINSIVFMSSEGESSNNKEVYFNDRIPDVLLNFSFKRMMDAGFDPDIFLRANKQRVVNRNHITGYQPKDQTIRIKAINSGNKMVEFNIEISEDYRPVFRKIFK